MLSSRAATTGLRYAEKFMSFPIKREMLRSSDHDCQLCWVLPRWGTVPWDSQVSVHFILPTILCHGTVFIPLCNKQTNNQEKYVTAF